MNGERIGARLHACLQGFPGAVIELSPDGIILASNARLEALLGRDVVARPFAELIDSTSQQKWAQLLARGVGAPEGSLWEFVLEGRGTLELRTFAAVWGREGPEESLWLLEYSRDLQLEPLYEELAAANSELVKAQRELSKERARLARALAQEAEARAEAEAAIRVRDEVLAVVAHDLRNPLMGILANASLLLHAPASEEVRAKRLQTIKSTGERMGRLIGDLLDVAAIQAGRLALDPQRLEVAPLLMGACEIFQPQAAAKDLGLECSVAHDLPAVDADQARLLQVLGNLLGNAIRLTTRGGRIMLRAERAGNEIRFSISDTGPGIAEEELPHLFERFWQADRSRRGGAGLGLAIAKGIVEAHGGRIWAESTLGHGASFFFALPCRE